MAIALKRNLLIGFGLSLLILIISSTASYMSINALFKSSDAVNHTNLVVQKLQQTISVMKDAETGQRGFLLTGKNEFLEPYNGSYAELTSLIAALQKLTDDNSTQQQHLNKLNDFIRQRFSKLQALIDEKRLSNTVNLQELQTGKKFMDSVRHMVSQMTDEENALLKSRTTDLTRFSTLTPVLIVAAALLAIIISVLFYLKMYKDINIRTKLQDELVQKDTAISLRISTIREVSQKISKGDYTVRVADGGTDELSGISTSLNSMAESLEKAFSVLSDNEWLQAGIAGLNDAMLGEENIHYLSDKIITFAAEYTGSQVGAFFITENQHQLLLKSGYALIKNNAIIASGEGLAGQAAKSKKLLHITDIREQDFNISFAAAEIKPVNFIAFPLLFQNEVKGVIELGALHQYTARELNFFKRISENIGVAINTVQNRQRVQELLEETQSQSEELMSQQSELEQINTELEMQTQQLQTSEEELKVQSEELIETNTLLEERSASLEQRNQLILQKNAEIEKKAADLALSTKYKSEFLANMSHELRTPLNSIILLSRLMYENNEQNLTADQVQYASVIQTSGNGLLQLIDEILDLSKIESGKMNMEHLPVAITDITNGMNALFEHLAREQKLEWKIDIGAEVPATIETDKMRLEQVLKNLLSNAFKFTSKGYIHLSVSCPVYRPGFICFLVKDSGIGINDEKLDLIFEAFQQEDGSTRRKYGGTGLGLSISRELAKLLGGEITVTSKSGEGSEFVCCVPVAKGIGKLPEQAGEKDGIPSAKNITGNIPEATRFAEKTKYDTSIIPEEISDDRDNIRNDDKVILIIEDDINFATALLDYTRQKGYKGLVAVRGDHGVSMAKKYLPMGILLDLQLPVKNGWQVMEDLKENVHTRHIPVHMMSSYEVKTESLLKGAVDFITKPVAFEQLNNIFEKIEFILNKKENKVLIVEENYKHAKALAYFLDSYNVTTEIFQSVDESIQSLHKKEVDCVILDLSTTESTAANLLQTVRENEGLENLPIILFTGKNLSKPEEFKIKKFADTIVMKTANSYKRILDEVSLFLHLVQEEQQKKTLPNFEQRVLQDNVLKDKKILLADDDVRNIYSMTKALEKYQMNVIPAMDGKEALQLVDSANADVVLMDMMMPEMDGYESIKAIRSNPLYKNLPIIAVTAKAMSGDREKCIAAGASDYISKPVDMDQLVSLLRIWLYEKGY